MRLKSRSRMPHHWSDGRPVLPKVERNKAYTVRVPTDMAEEIKALQEKWDMKLNDVLNVILINGLDMLRNSHRK